jgi:hypothetical protein
MRISLAAIAALACLTSTAAFAAPADDYARWLAGPWGRVDLAWKPYSGILSKNSCPLGPISKKESIGLMGEGGTMWIEPGLAGALSLYDGGVLPRVLSFVRLEADGAAVYREGGVERRFARVGPDALTENRLPLVAGMPGTNYLRCKKKP